MSNINIGKVVLGGLLAGLVINIAEFVLHGVVLAADWVEVMKSLKRPTETTTAQITGFVVSGFVIGILAVWLYAAIRPRFGAGPGTAATAGFFIWVLGYVMGSAGPVIQGIYPMRLVTIACAVGLVEAIVATILGAAVYKEEAAAATPMAAAAGR